MLGQGMKRSKLETRRLGKGTGSREEDISAPLLVWSLVCLSSRGGFPRNASNPNPNQSKPSSGYPVFSSSAASSVGVSHLGDPDPNYGLPEGYGTV